jgi:glutamyl-tRNA reductase
MEGTKVLHLCGVNFRTAPAGVREVWHFTAPEAQALLRRTAGALPELEAVVLSTCNRTEFYLAAEAGGQVVARWRALVRTSRPRGPFLGGRGRRYERRGRAAARHLFRVAAGLDSAILGDVQILSQVKAAWSLAATAGALGKSLQQTLHHAVRVGRRARAETAISQGCASIGSALAGWLAPRCRAAASGQPVHIVVLGAGEAARNIAHHLSKPHLGRLSFLNRTEARAADLAKQCAGQAYPWQALPEVLAAADVVIAATAAPRPVLERALLEQVVGRRPGRPLLVVDAGLPRNVEPGGLAEVVGIDTLREQQESVLRQRQTAVPAAEVLVDQEVRAWRRWWAARPVEALIKRLYQDVHRHCGLVAHELAAVSAVSAERAEQIVSRSVKRLLHRHVRDLRDHAR